MYSIVMGCRVLSDLERMLVSSYHRGWSGMPSCFSSRRFGQGIDPPFFSDLFANLLVYFQFMASQQMKHILDRHKDMGHDRKRGWAGGDFLPFSDQSARSGRHRRVQIGKLSTYRRLVNLQVLCILRRLSEEDNF